MDHAITVRDVLETSGMVLGGFAVIGGLLVLFSIYARGFDR